MNLSDIAIVFSMTTTLVAGAGAGGKYYLDNEFISGDELQEYEIRQLKREARKLKRAFDSGDITVEDDYLDLLDEIEDLEDM